MEPTLYIGIDPGVETGIAVWKPAEKRFLLIDTTSIGRAIGICLMYFDKYVDLHLVVEERPQADLDTEGENALGV